MSCQCKREASPMEPPLKRAKTSLEPIDYRANSVGLPRMEAAAWDALAVGKDEGALLKTAISRGSFAKKPQFACVNQLAAALDSGKVLETLKRRGTYAEPSGKKIYLTTKEIISKVRFRVLLTFEIKHNTL